MKNYYYPYNRGRAQYGVGEYAVAVENLTDALQRNKLATPPRIFLIASLVRLGRQDEAEWEIMEMEANNPEYMLARIERHWPLRNLELKAQLLDDLRQARMVD